MIVPSAWRAESLRVARIAGVVEPTVCRPQRATACRSVVTVKHVVAFHLVIEQRDVVIIDVDENPIRAVVQDLVASNLGIDERPPLTAPPPRCHSPGSL